MAKSKHFFQCSQCAYVSPSYLGKCPECSAWGSFTEEITSAALDKPENQRRTQNNMCIPLNEVTSEQAERFSSGSSELDRVLGGGILPGAYVLIGGDPGIGKSTLMLQTVSRIQNQTVLYIAGEESAYQIKLRSDRLKLTVNHVLMLAETNVHRVIETIKSNAGKPLTVVIDSIQALYDPEIGSTPGSVTQIRQCASLLMDVAKSLNVTIFLIGHVTKDGSVSGPKVLEHMVDAVLYFEGDKYKNLRMLRTVKNRFGDTNEVGVFEMTAEGLVEVDNPSNLFLSHASTLNNPGSVIVATLEGNRPILIELQALVGVTTYPAPRRVANGIDTNRLHQIIAVLERRLGLDFSRQDVYINVVGGLEIDDPGADLGIAFALLTSHRNISMLPHTAVAGEIGLTGEIRPVRQLPLRVKEAQRIGFQQIITPLSDTPLPDGLTVLEADSLMSAITVALPPHHEVTAVGVQ